LYKGCRRNELSEEDLEFMNDVDKHVLGQKLSKEELLKQINAWCDPEGRGYRASAGVAVYDNGEEKELEQPKKSRKSRRSSNKLVQSEDGPLISEASTAEGTAAVPRECNHAGNNAELEKGGFFGLFGKKNKPAAKKSRRARRGPKKSGKRGPKKGPRKGRKG